MDPSSFELLSGFIPFGNSCIRVQMIYRMPPSAKNKLKKGDFINEFASLLEIVTTLPGKLLIAGDFNIHWEDPNDPEKCEFEELLLTFGLQQHVSDSTHLSGHVLDFVITRPDDNIVHSVKVADIVSDHFLVLASLAVTRPTSDQQVRSFRKIQNINMCDFQGDLEQAVSKIDCDELDLLAKQISHAMSSVLDSHTPIQIKKLSSKTMVPWFNNSIKRAIIKWRRFERLWRKDKIEIKRRIVEKSKK